MCSIVLHEDFGRPEDPECDCGYELARTLLADRPESEGDGRT